MEAAEVLVGEAQEATLGTWQARRFVSSASTEPELASRISQLQPGRKAVVPLSTVRSDSPFGWRTCVVCKGCTSSDSNSIVLCATCDNGYHQRCHNPRITEDVIHSSPPWACCYCTAGRCNLLTRVTLADTLKACIHTRKRKAPLCYEPTEKRATWPRGATRFCNRSLSNGESDLSSPEYEMSDEDGSAGAASIASTPSPALLWPEQKGSQSQHSIKLILHTSDGETGQSGSSEKREKATFSNGEKNNQSPDMVDEPSGDQRQGNHDEEEELIDVEGDDDNSANADDLDGDETNCNGSARTRGDCHSASSLCPLTQTSLVSRSQPPIAARTPSLNTWAVSSAELSPKEFSNPCSNQGLPSVSFYASWVARATADRRNSESSEQSLPISSEKNRGGTAQAKPCLPTAAALLRSGRITMPRLHESTFTQPAAVEKPSEMLSIEIDENTKLSRSSFSVDAVQQIKEVKPLQMSTSSNRRAESQVISCMQGKQQMLSGSLKSESGLARTGSEAQQLKRDREMPQPLPLQNPFRQWVYSSAQHCKNAEKSDGHLQADAREHQSSSLPKTSPKTTPRLPVQRPINSPMSRRTRHRLSTDSVASMSKRHSSTSSSTKLNQSPIESPGGEDLSQNHKLMDRLTMGFLLQPLAGVQCINESKTMKESSSMVSGLRSEGAFSATARSLFIDGQDLATIPVGHGILCGHTMHTNKPVKQLLTEFALHFNNVVSRLTHADELVDRRKN